MKTLHLSIIVISGIVLIASTNLVFAEQPLLKFYNNSDRVLVGKIISSSQVPTMTGDTTQYPNQTRYDVQVEEYYKDSQDFKLVTVYGYAKGIYFEHDPTYDVGDRVFLYLVKKNGFYQIQFPSFKMDNNCDARSMVPMSVLPFEGPEIAGPAGGSPFDFVGSDGSKRLTYMVGEKIHINFVATNYLPMVKYATLNFLIKTDNDTKLVFNNTKQIMLPACDGNVLASWDFVPENRGSYSVYANMSSSINLGGTGLLFTEPTIQSSFDVLTHLSSIKLEKSPYLLPPLQQFKSGISALNVKCNQNFQLAIKTEDGSPVCVKDPSIGRLVRQGWWAWNDRVGDTVVNTPEKRDFDSKSCVISETMSSIVGTGGFVRDDLPSDGVTYPGENLTGLVDESIQFAIKPNSSAQIVFTYDFNPYPGSNCKVTTKDAMTYINMARSNTLISNTTRSNTQISNFQISPDIFEVDKTRIRTDIPLLGDTGDIQVKLINAEDLNDHVVKVTYQIISKPTSQIGKSYLLSFWWHSAVGVTVGNDLYNGTAFSGPRFG